MGTKTRILVLDDDDNFNKILRKQLTKEGFEVAICHDPTKAEGVLEEQRFDILLLDIMMPEVDGYEFCMRMRSNYRYFSTFIIMISALTKTKHKIQGFEAGADDYMTKPVVLDELVARIHRAERELNTRRQAMLDGLTKVFNRYSFNELLSREIESAKRYKDPLSMLLIDLDHFKRVNDLYGHAKGDEVLVQLADILRKACRNSDFICRWGGEEFVMLLPKTEAKAAKKIAERLRNKVENTDFGLNERLTISIGGTQFKEEAGKFFRRSDEALYEAKESGRNQVIWKKDSSK